MTIIRLAAACLLAAMHCAAAPQAMSAGADHARLLRLLGIETLRRGADGDPDSPHAANYDEALANEHMGALPELLMTDAGEPVTTADQWWTTRRPEIVEHFEREIYGRVPADMPRVEWQVLDMVEGRVEGHDVVTLSVEGRLRSARDPGVTAVIPFTLTRPVSAVGDVPVVLELSFGEEFLRRLRERFTAEQLEAFTGGGPPWRRQVLDRGWAFASMDGPRVQADDGAGLTAGVIGVGNNGEPRDLDDWGALRAWGWGASRIVDFLESRDGYDGSRVAVFGHSRFGKAALVAMAFDERIAAGFISSSGEGGAKLWRRHFGEQIGNIAGSGEYHWVAGNFLRYAGPLDATDLPVDAHALIALCAPRPVFVSSGDDGDEWTDPRGMFLAAAAASPVYELLGAGGLGTTAYPPIGDLVSRGALAWRQHALGHTPGPNWSYFLDFAARAFARPGAAAAFP